MSVRAAALPAPSEWAAPRVGPEAPAVLLVASVAPGPAPLLVPRDEPVAPGPASAATDSASGTSTASAPTACWSRPAFPDRATRTRTAGLATSARVHRRGPVARPEAGAVTVFARVESRSRTV